VDQEITSLKQLFSLPSRTLNDDQLELHIWYNPCLLRCVPHNTFINILLHIPYFFEKNGEIPAFLSPEKNRAKAPGIACSAATCTVCGRVSCVGTLRSAAGTRRRSVSYSGHRKGAAVPVNIYIYILMYK
jgi:hypothetical protein